MVGRFHAVLRGSARWREGEGEGYRRQRTIAGTVNAVVAAYLDCSPISTSPFKTHKPETQRTRRNILENFRKAHGDKPLYRNDRNGERIMLLKREHMQKIINEKVEAPFAQRNLLNTLRAMFQWAQSEGRVPDDPTLGVTRRKVKRPASRRGTKPRSRALSRPSDRHEGAVSVRIVALHRPTPRRCGAHRPATHQQ